MIFVTERALLDVGLQAVNRTRRKVCSLSLGLGSVVARSPEREYTTSISKSVRKKGKDADMEWEGGKMVEANNAIKLWDSLIQR